MASTDAPRVAVIGAGITGFTTAYNLAKRGAKVTIFDRHPYAAMETSFANGGLPFFTGGIRAHFNPHSPAKLPTP